MIAIILWVMILDALAEDRAGPPPLRGTHGSGDGGEVGNGSAAVTAVSAGAATMANGTWTTAEAGSGPSRSFGDGGSAAAAAADLAALAALAANLSEGSNVSADGGVESLLLLRGGWHQGGDKMWGSGTGVESISHGNVGYYDAGMYAAHARCGGAGCALIVNPPGHRSVQQFHIHFVHYRGYGASLKRRLEGRVCGRYGWHGGGLPCGGSAAYFPGFPAVFSKAMAGGHIHHASVIAWPASCGGRGTIVELAYGCSIEHQIRGDYNPRYR